MKQQRSEEAIRKDLIEGAALTLKVLIADSWVEKSRINRNKEIRRSAKAGHNPRLLQLLEAAGAITNHSKSKNVVINETASRN